LCLSTMSKIRAAIIAVMSANGVLSRGSSLAVDWSSREDKKFFKNLTRKMGVVVMGRKTFETLNYKPLSGRLNVVLSRTPHHYRDPLSENLIITDMPPEKLLHFLQERGYNDVAIIGGPQIFSLFLEHGLITDIYLTIEPIVLSGDVHFQLVEHDHFLKLLELRKLSSDSILLHYTLKNHSG